MVAIAYTLGKPANVSAQLRGTGGLHVLTSERYSGKSGRIVAGQDNHECSRLGPLAFDTLSQVVAKPFPAMIRANETLARIVPNPSLTALGTAI